MYTNNVFKGRGRLVQDPKKVDINETTKKAYFAIAINNRRKTKDGQYVDDTDFVNCEVWDSAADIVLSKYKKGQELEVIGAIKSYSTKFFDSEGKEVNVHRSYIRVNSFSPLRGPKAEVLNESEGSN